MTTTRLENARGCESAPAAEHGVKSAASEAYTPGDKCYSNIFTNKATSDCTKTDAQLNSELNCQPSPYDSKNGGLSDIQQGLNSDGAAKSDLQKAMQDAQNGDTTTAMKDLRQATGDLNNAGGSFDSGMSSLDSYLNDDKSAKTLMNKGYDDGDKAESKIEKAERMLRNGDTQGAIKAMGSGIRQIGKQQHHAGESLDRLTEDVQLSAQPDDSCSAQGGQNVQPTDQGTSPSCPTDGSSSSSTPFPFGDGTPTFPPDLENVLPNPSNLLGGLPNPSDLFNGLPQPPNPFDMSGGLPQPPNPFDMFGGLPTPPNPSDLLSSLPTPPSPSDLLNGLGSIAQNPIKPIENLLTPPDLSKPQDVIKKIFDPFGIF